MKVAIFGSAFNPPTLGHLDAIYFVLSGGIDQVWLVPSFSHAFGKSMLDYEIRLTMLRHFVADIDQDSVQITAIEKEIACADNPVFTWDVLTYLQNRYPEYQFSFVIGPDNNANWDKFYKAQEIKDRWPLITVPERRAIRSTMVRNACSQGKSIAHMVTPSVAELLMQQRLYLNTQ